MVLCEAPLCSILDWQMAYYRQKPYFPRETDFRPLNLDQQVQRKAGFEMEVQKQT